MGSLARLVLLLFLSSAAAIATLKRSHVLAEAQAGVARSAMLHTSRRASRAASHSTFGRFLSGGGAPVCSPVLDQVSAEASPVIAVAAFGADPTGVRDSSDAFAAAWAAAVANVTVVRYMASKIRDLGGVKIDLQGGDYALSRPFSLPAFYGNFKIGGGTVRAMEGFPAGRYMVEVGGDKATCDAIDPKQKACNANIGIEDLMVDGNHTAFGAIQVTETAARRNAPPPPRTEPNRLPPKSSTRLWAGTRGLTCT
jgi:hypothetical protein